MKMSKNFIIYSAVAVVVITIIVGFSIAYGILPLVSQIDQNMSMKFSPAQTVQSVIYKQDYSILMVTLVVFLVCLMFFIIQVIFVFRKVIYPLRKTIKFSTKLAKGDFTAELTCNQKESDEIFELAKSLNFMRDRMQSYIGRLQTSRAREQSARRKAESVNTLKGDFLSNMSLELKNPLNSIMGFSRMLIKEAEQGKYDENVLRKCKIIHQSAEALNSFVEKLFNLSRLDSGDHPVNPTAIVTTNLLHDLCEINCPEAEKKSISITTHFSSSQPDKIIIDRDIFMNAMNMVISGIIRTSPVKSEIVIGCNIDGENVFFYIKAPVVEEGSMCVATTYKKNFMRSSSTQLSQLSGAVMVNLAISKYSFDIINGRVSIEGPSEAGSTFKVSFIGNDVLQDEDEDGSSALHYATNLDNVEAGELPDTVDAFSLEQHFPLKVAILESDNNTQILLRELVNIDGHSLKVFKSEIECLQSLNEYAVDILILESTVPHRKASGFIHNLSHKVGKKPFIIILTTHISETERQKLIISGADECIRKPIDVDSFLQIFKKLSHQHGMNDMDE